MRHYDTIIIGGGISGLSAAFFLKKKGKDVLLLEKSDRVGGVMASQVKDGFLLEEGPNTMMGMSEAVKTIIQDCRLESDLVLPGQNAKKRFICKSGRLYEVPLNPIKFLSSPLLSGKAKLRILKEPWISKSTRDETIGDFFTRRFGSGVTTAFVDPFVSGVYAGDIRTLSMSACFPKLVEWERSHGSVLRGMLKQERGRSNRTLYSFRDGLGTLPRAVERWMEFGLEKDTKSTQGASVLKNSIVKNIGLSGQGFQIQLLKEGQQKYAKEEEFTCNRLILATPAYVSAELLQHVDSELARELLTVPYAPLSIYYFGFQRKDVGHPLDGFGYLVPRSEQKNILGVLFSSSLFPNRAPDGQVLLTVMAQGSDAGLKEVLSELKSTLNITAHPIFAHSHHYMKAIPQYVMGHVERIDRIKSLEQKYTGLSLMGNYFDGVSTSACIESSRALTSI